MRYRWELAGAAVLAVFLGLILVITRNMPHAQEELLSSFWRAGTITNRSVNDIWIEYNPVTREITSIYRDYDGDGLIDERIVFSGPLITVFRASNRDGVLNTMRNVDQPLDSVVRLPRDSADAGPFTRSELDDLARRHPLPFRR